MSSFANMVRRLRRSWGWVVAQFGGTLVLLLVALAWTRLPDRHVWQVALTLLLALLLGISVLELEAGTARAFADDDGRRVLLVFGAVSLLFWLALAASAWVLLDWCDDHIVNWASYLNSRASAHARATVFTFAHLSRWLTLLEWVLRWIAVPGALLPGAVASAQSGWRVPWRRVVRVVLGWRWWIAVVIAALASVALPGRLFDAAPHGAVTRQVAAVALKLATAYVLALASWIVLLAWAATLMRVRRGAKGNGSGGYSGDPQPEPALVGPSDGSRSAAVRLPLPKSSNGFAGNS